ncbi:hypothetical protein Sjap_014791 [Stephania japonica]|uniref:Uncharacterized protein n=1 Tax=Stephania japonica TaxID=461633 RepID=A0AAP0IHX9_9MAGN
MDEIGLAQQQPPPPPPTPPPHDQQQPPQIDRPIHPNKGTMLGVRRKRGSREMSRTPVSEVGVVGIVEAVSLVGVMEALGPVA